MKRPAEQNHYELLEVAPGASRRDIRVAYELARRTYSGESPAVQPLFSADERARLFRQIEAAYRTLDDPEARRRYDAALGIAPIAAVSVSPTEEVTKAPLIVDVLPEGEVTGAVLRRIREQQGRRLEEIADRTRINLAYLQDIEEDAMMRLPPEVFLRGYVGQYATVLRLDAKEVTEGYLKRYRAWKQQSGAAR